MKLFNIFKKAGLATVFLFSVHVAQAGLPPPGYFSFEAEVMSGDYAGTMGFGEVLYDPGFLTSGSVRLDPNFGLIDFYFTILGQTFYMFDDAGFPGSPTVDFIDFMPDYMSFRVEDDGVDIWEPNVTALGISSSIFGLSPGAICPAIHDYNGCYGYNYFVEAYIEVAPVPEVPIPAALWLFGSGLLGLVGVSRRKKMH